MSLNSVIERHWPPQCCVPAFVVAALEALGHDVPHPMTMPHVLGVRVGPNDDNPLCLPVVVDPMQQGVTASSARERIDAMLQDLSLPVHFKLTPLNTIPWNGAEVLAKEALAAGAVLGIGVLYDEIDETVTTSARHILRISALSDGIAEVVDDSGEAPERRFTLSFEKLETAATAANDGLWLFIPADAVLSGGLLPH